jgi:hypothetical protein
MLKGGSGRWDAGLKQLGPRKCAVAYGDGYVLRSPRRQSSKRMIAAWQAVSLKRSKRRPSLAEIKF